MNNESINFILDASKDVYYTDLLLILCILVTVTRFLFLLSRDKYSKLFLFYCIAALLLNIRYYLALFPLFKDYSGIAFNEGANTIFAVIEYIVFYYYFSAIITSGFIKKVMKLFYVLVILAMLFFFFEAAWIKVDEYRLYKIANYIISSELFVLAMLCFAYYLEIFRKKNLENVSQSPAFLITTSLLFYTIIVIPFFVLVGKGFSAANKDLYYIMFALHFISFCFLFLAITKASLCKKPLTT